VDQGYTGSGREWIERELGWNLEVVQHPAKPRGEWVPLGTGADPRPFEWRRLPPERSGFRGVLPRRWVVERVRHEAPWHREEVRDLLLRAVAAA
jgi:putative transposase